MSCEDSQASASKQDSQCVPGFLHWASVDMFFYTSVQRTVMPM